MDWFREWPEWYLSEKTDGYYSAEESAEKQQPQNMLPEGFIAGEPEEYTDGTTIAFTSDNGEVKQGVVIGRALFDGEKFVPAESGRFIELYVQGEDEPSHIHEDKISERVVGYLGENTDQNNEPQEPETEQPAEVEQPTQEQQSVVSDTPTEETQETQTEQPAETGKTPAQLTYEGIIAKYGDNAGHKIDVTIADKQQELAKAQKDLDKKQKAYDDAPIGKEDKAERELAKAQQEYSKILAETQSWDAIKAEHDRVLESEKPMLEVSVPQNNSSIDENGLPFTKASDGSIDFGEITEDTGLQSAPIRLSEGNSSYGKQHIEARHGEQIRNAGFGSVEEFVEFVAKNYDRENIKIGKRRKDNKSTFLIQIQDEHSNILYIELSKDGSYWNVNSGGVFRSDYAENKENVRSASEVQNNGSATVYNALQYKSDTEKDLNSNRTAPDVSSGKDTNISGTDQKNIEKKSESTISQNVASGVTAQSRKPKEGNVPDMVVDKASDARARGFRMKDGNRYDRQKQIEDGVSGKLTSIDFSTTEKPVSAHYTVIEADELQPSHIGGSRNPLHFISEAQPKERTDDVSDIESTRIAQNIAPEKITSSTNAYGGAPVINSRGEVIQGNNRAIALRKLQGYPQAEERYRQYLVDHAKDFGFDDNGVGRIKAMKHPVLVRQTDRSLTDEEAIRLGQFKATDLETGGIVRIEAAPTLAKMNAQSVESAMNILLGTADENDESSLNQLIEANGGNLIGYLVRKGAITETQAQSAFGRGDRLTEDARSDIRKLVLQTMFSDAPDNIEAMFNRIPSAAQKALMQVIAGDMRLGQRERLLPDIQNAIMAAGEVQERLSGQLNEVRKNKDARTRHEEIRKLMVYASRQPDITGNTVISQDYSELELEIATILLSDAQNSIKAIFSEYQRYVNGEPTIFGGVERLSREEAVEKTFKVKDTRYGTERQTDSTTGNSGGSVEQTGAQRGQTGETGLLERPRMADGVSADQESVQPSGRPSNGGESAVGGKSGGFDESGRPGQVNSGVSADKAEAAFTDNQGNPTDESGNLILERVGSVDEITDEDFTSPKRNVWVPVSNALLERIGNGNRPVIIKKNIFEKNRDNHKDLTPNQSREILNEALNATNLYGQTQPKSRSDYWVAIRLSNRNKIVVIEVSKTKDNTEVVGWHYIDAKGIQKLESQAEREDGQLLILTTDEAAAAALSTLPSDELSVGKDTKNSGTDKEKNAEMQLEPITNSAGEVENIEELKDSNPDVSTEEAENKPTETAVKAAKQTKLNIETQSQEKIEDFGEKIGGARKDTAKSGFKRGDGDGRPAWRKKYKFINTDETVELGVSGLSTGRGLYSAGSIIKALYQSKPHTVSNIDGDFDADKPFYAYYEEKKKTRWGTDVKYRPIVGKDGKLVRFSNVQEAEKVIPVFEAEQQGFRVKAGADGKFVVYRTASNGKNVEYDEFDSREDAVAYLLSEEGATSLLNRKRENFELPGLDKVTREGVPDYRNGKNVTTDDFMETFGFRGGEFGNWVNNDERQSALNTAYDALMDLATVLGLSPRALSLGGRLGIAFGARGTAGAKAHYEPVKAVINLTKVHGAGSLAHEWGHALDNYFALMDSKTDRNTAQERDLESYMTEGQSWKKGVREEIRDIFSKIVDVLTKKKVTKKIALSEEQEAYDNIIRAIDKEARRYRTLFEQGRTVRRYNRKTKEYETVTVKPTTEQLEEYDRLVEELKDDDTFLWGPYPTGDVARKLMLLVKDVEPGKRGSRQPLHNLWYYRTRLTPQKKRLAKAKNGEAEEVSVESDILKNSEWFDKMRATPYFSQNIEMFARAFESYVERKMTGNGMQSTYLTYEKGSIYQSVWEHNPYPAGEEAGKLDALFDEFFKTVQEKEIDGKTVLYHKADGESVTIDEADMAMAEGLEEIFREAGIAVSGDVEKGQRLLDRVNGNIKMSAAESERRREREEIRNTIAEAISIVTGKSMAEAKRELVESEAQRKMDAKEIYGIILSGEYNSVSLQKIQDFINNATPENKYGRRVSERLPQRVEREMLKGKRGDEVEALYTRASESAIPANERTREATRGGIAEAKKSLLEKWAKAAGKWHTELSDFTDASEPIDSGHDSDVYPARDREHVIKLSRGKNDKRFKSDPDAVTLFNYVFPNSAYRVLGYGNFGKGFVRILEQPYVNFATSTPLTVEERVEYMDRLGFKPINKECTAFSNGELLVADLQKSNIVRSKDGNIRVIDADVKLHTKDVGGNYTYLPVEHDLPDGANVKQMRFFRTESGEVYGFTLDGEIYIDKRIAGSETYIHEYTHLWAEALRKANSKAWEQLKKEMFADKDLTDYVKAKYPELTSEDELAEEVFAHYSGKRGAERLKAEMKAEMEKADGVFEKAKVGSVFANIKALLDRFWNMARDLFSGKVEGIEKMKSEDFADMAMNDLLRGFNPNKASKASDVVKSNPMQDDYHTGIRDYSDVKTFREVIEDDFSGTPDYTEADARKAIETGRITVYSSKPIETGNFVTPSKMEAKSYAGVGRIYSKEVSIDDVAWIDSMQGQYAPMEGENVRFHKVVDENDEREVPIVKANKEHGFANFKEAKQWAKENIVGEYENPEVGMVNVSNASIDKYLSEKAVSKSDSKDVHLSALKVVPSIIESSVVGEIHEDKNGSENVHDIVRLYGCIDIDGTPYRVKSTIKRYVNDNEKTKAYSYEVTEIELLEGTHEDADRPLPRTTSNSIRVAKLVKKSDIAKKNVSERDAEGDIRYRDGYEENVEYSEPFYSNAFRAVEGIKQEKATPEQWLAMLQKNGGLKAGEDKWLGLSEWLKASDKKSLTKQEVLDYIRANEIQVEEVEYEEFDTDNLLDYYMKKSNPINGTRLDYTTKGLKNKKEIALTVPTIEPYNENDEIHFGDAGHGRTVAWVRFGDATSANADGTVSKVLVIDEIQSKRHQDGREKGYSKPFSQEERDAEMKAFEESLDKEVELSTKLNNLVIENGDFSEYDRLTEELNAITQKNLEWNDEIDSKYNINGNRVPDAPFDKNWHELAMKRMLRYAAENGYDKVAWTTGEQQAERYNLSKSIDRLDVYKQGNGLYTVTADHSGQGQLFSKSDVKESELSELIGKELAEKAIRDLSYDFMNRTVYRDTDLKVGGEGMKGFYDKMLPDFMNKYGKKWGVKVGDVELALPNEADRVMHSVDVTNQMKEGVMLGQPMFRLAETEPAVKATAEKERTPEAKRETATRLAARLNTPVRVIEDVNEITHTNGAIESRRRRAKGWYNTNTGEVVIVLPNNRNTEDVAATMCHEIVAHKGLRELVGEENYNTFLDEVYEHLNGELKYEVDMKAGRSFTDDTLDNGEKAKSYEEHRRMQVDELFGRLAEKPFEDFTEKERTLWQHIKEAVRRILDRFLGTMKLPSWVELGDNELRYMLWRSRERLEHGKENYVDKARDIVKRNELGLDDEAVYARVSKEGYERKAAYARRLHEDNKVIGMKNGLTGEQCDTLMELASLRHELHSNIDNLVKSDTYNIKPRIVKLNARLKELGLPTISNVPEYEEDYIDIDTIEELLYYDDVDVPDSETPEWMDWYNENYYRIYTELEQLNNEIEKYLGEIDDKYQTRYKPTGKSRILYRDGEDIEEVNSRFNEELQQQIDGTLPKGHVYQIGRPGEILQSAGVPNLPIELVASKLSDKSMQENHPFELSEINGLVKAIQNPLAVFRSATKNGSHVILTEIKHGDKSFVVAIETNRNIGKIHVNSIRSVHYRRSMNILGWIEDGLTDYVSDLFKERWMFQTKIELLSKPQYNSADVRKKLNSIAKILKNFENPPVFEKNILENSQPLENEDIRYRDGEDTPEGTDDIWNDQSMGMQEKMTLAAMRLAELNKNDAGAKSEAVRMANKSLMSLTKAMRLQKQFDKTTVKRVSDLAKVLIRHGYISDMGRSEVSRLLSVINNAAGRQDIKKDVQKVMDIMIDNQLRRAEESLGKLMATKGTKTDSRGVVVQGVLDVAGQQVMKTFKAARSWKEEEIEDAIADAMEQPLAVRSGSSRRCRSCWLGVWPQM